MERYHFLPPEPDRQRGTDLSPMGEIIFEGCLDLGGVHGVGWPLLGAEIYADRAIGEPRKFSLQDGGSLARAAEDRMLAEVDGETSSPEPAG